jgi:hypothetical protein
MGQHQFEVPDREGFEALLNTRLIRFGDMVFRKSTFTPGVVARRLRDSGSLTVQRELNHVDLILYASDIEVQTGWAEELCSYWRRRSLQEFPDLEMRLEATETGGEVTVTFWSECSRDRLRLVQSDNPRQFWRIQAAN